MTDYLAAGRLGYRIFHTYRSIHEGLSIVLDAFGINPSQWGVLNRLAANGPMTQAQLAAAVQRQPATITNTVDRMVKAGLISRTPSASDRRVNIISILPKGEEILAEAIPAVTAYTTHLAEGMSPADVALLVDALNRIDAKATAFVESSAPAD
ncbi:MAG: MarR family transcriptional regulator [Eggerthellaceae bacterium]|nr:MarR family transcriptional regulator [Eggerthellaceae bacterium]